MIEENVEVVSEEVAPEKLVPQSEVNDLVGHAKARGAEQARRQAEAEFQKKLEAMQAQKQLDKQVAGSSGEDARQIDADAMYQQVRERLNEEMRQKQIESHMRQIADAYEAKISAGNELYDDYKDVMQDFDSAAFPQVVYLVANMDNAAEVMYDLSKNPSKLSVIDSLAHKSPQLAQRELQKISKGLAENRAALAEEARNQTNDPLDRMQSTTRNNGNGPMSISDLKSQDWLKG